MKQAHDPITRIELFPVFVPFQERVRQVLQGGTGKVAMGLDVDDHWLGGDFLVCRMTSENGVVGFGDPATSMGFEQHDEDFGQTLAVWGAGEGPYLMIPIFGPSNPRDAIGKVVDFFLDPINWWAPSEGLDSVLWGRTVMTGIDTRSQLWEVLDDLEKSSIDFYASIRSLYRQRRNDEITNGEGLDDKPPPGFSGDFEIADPDQEPDQDSDTTKQ